MLHSRARASGGHPQLCASFPWKVCAHSREMGTWPLVLICGGCSLPPGRGWRSSCICWLGWVSLGSGGQGVTPRLMSF